jgi:hypothetical protein
MAGRREARDILGFPVVPPARLTKAVVASRRALGRAHREAAPPSLRVLEGLFGLFDNRALGLLVEMDLPDLLDRPRTTEELALSTGTSTENLRRLLRYSAGRGFLRCDRDGHWRASPVTEVLRRDHPNSWRGWVELAASDWFWDAWRHAGAALRGERSGLEEATGHDFFDFVNRIRPDAGDTFNRAMAAGATVQALALSEALDWSGVRTVCDVGGGTGAALEYLLGTHPTLHGVLFDLPEVIAAARPVLRSGTLAGRCRLEPGSFFDEVPGGADRYLLLAVVHDWEDPQAVALLRRVGAALTPGARAVVVEGVLPERPRDDFVQASDLLMCVLATGRERTAGEFDQLFSDSSLALESRVPLATGFTAFVLAAESA